jgi:tRNA A37 methylthiotransferase MiaB
MSKKRILVYSSNNLGKDQQISITKDIIVGFPGETKNDYQETIDMMEKIRFDSII